MEDQNQILHPWESSKTNRKAGSVLGMRSFCLRSLRKIAIIVDTGYGLGLEGAWNSGWFTKNLQLLFATIYISQLLHLKLKSLLLISRSIQRHSPFSRAPCCLQDFPRTSRTLWVSSPSGSDCEQPRTCRCPAAQAADVLSVLRESPTCLSVLRETQPGARSCPVSRTLRTQTRGKRPTWSLHTPARRNPRNQFALCKRP